MYHTHATMSCRLCSHPELTAGIPGEPDRLSTSDNMSQGRHSMWPKGPAKLGAGFFCTISWHFPKDWLRYCITVSLLRWEQRSLGYLPTSSLAIIGIYIVIWGMGPAGCVDWMWDVSFSPQLGSQLLDGPTEEVTWIIVLGRDMAPHYRLTYIPMNACAISTNWHSPWKPLLSS